MGVLLAGGGTAGHLFPCIAVAEELQAAYPDMQVRFVGASGRVDAQLLAARGLTHELIDARPMPYSLSLAAIHGAIGLVRGVSQAGRIIRDFSPQVVFSTGGYVGAAAAIAAHRARVPLVLHASDVQPDRSNRMAAHWAAAVTCVSPAAAEVFGEIATVTGHPIRREVAEATREHGMAELGLEPGRPTLVVTGGSQGARRLNMAVIGALPELLDGLGMQVVHLSGALDYASLRGKWEELGSPEHYHLIEHLPNAGLALAAADLLITRAGAASLAEACLHGVPMIVVPYPHAGGHQRLNAEPVAASGAAVLVDDEAFTTERLLALVREIVPDAERLSAMHDAAMAAAKPGAAQEIAQIVRSVAVGGLAGSASGL